MFEKTFDIIEQQIEAAKKGHEAEDLTRGWMRQINMLHAACSHWGTKSSWVREIGVRFDPVECAIGIQVYAPADGVGIEERRRAQEFAIRLGRNLGITCQIGITYGPACCTIPLGIDYKKSSAPFIIYRADCAQEDADSPGETAEE